MSSNAGTLVCDFVPFAVPETLEHTHRKRSVCSQLCNPRLGWIKQQLFYCLLLRRCYCWCYRSPAWGTKPSHYPVHQHVHLLIVLWLKEIGVVLLWAEDDLLSLTAFGFKRELWNWVVSCYQTRRSLPSHKADRETDKDLCFTPLHQGCVCCWLTKRDSDSVMQVFGWLDFTACECVCLEGSVLDLSLLVFMWATARTLHTKMSVVISVACFLWLQNVAHPKTRTYSYH